MWVLVEEGWLAAPVSPGPGMVMIGTCARAELGDLVCLHFDPKRSRVELTPREAGSWVVVLIKLSDQVYPGVLREMADLDHERRMKNVGHLLSFISVDRDGDTIVLTACYETETITLDPRTSTLLAMVLNQLVEEIDPGVMDELRGEAQAHLMRTFPENFN